MTEPTASRPHMPGYGILPAEAGLLPWSWAMERLRASHDYWVATVWPDGRPHLMPVWGVWYSDELWFSTGVRSRKIRNIEAGSAINVSTEDPRNPVVVDGTAEIMTETAALQRFIDAVNYKYQTDYSVDYLDPEENASVRVRPTSVFGLADGDFNGSPTRWAFGD